MPDAPTIPLQFAAQSYQARSVQEDPQRCINMFCEKFPSDAKSPVPVYQAPGLDLFSRLGTGPIWGLHGFLGTLYAVSGNQLFSINADGLATLIGATNLGGIVSMADNGTQMVMVDGNAGWIYQPGGLHQVLQQTALAGATSVVIQPTGIINAGDTINIPLDSGFIVYTTVAGAIVGGVVPLTSPLPGQATSGAVATVPTTVLGQILAPAFMPAATVVYFDSYFVFDAAGTNQFFLSALGDGTQYDGLDFASAQANSDLVLAVVNYHEQLLIFGQKSIEVWYDAGNATFPFARFDGAYIQRGLAAPHAICQEDNTVLWLGEDGIFYRLNGYQPVRISTFATEHAWGQYPTLTDVSCFVLWVEGHKFAFLVFPSGKATWCYDISSGADMPLWHERISWGNPWV